jgi:hypothetical protein
MSLWMVPVAGEVGEFMEVRGEIQYKVLCSTHEGIAVNFPNP